MQRMLTIMREQCGLNSSSHLVDIGSGLGRPLLHALVTEGISGATGIELDSIKCMKAEAFLKQTANTMLKRGLTEEALDLPVIECKPVEKVRSLDPATHAYSFWEGVPVDARVAFGRLFASSRSLRSVTVVQRSMRFEDPEEVMEHGYCFGPVTLVETLSVSMSGSNRHFTAYVFNKTQPPAAMPRRRGARAAHAAVAEVVAAVGTPPLSADAAKLCSKNSTDNLSGLDAVSKKLDLAEVEVASPFSKRIGHGGGGSSGQKPLVVATRRSKRKAIIDPEAEDVDIVTMTRQMTASPKKKAKPVAASSAQAALSTRSSPRKQPPPQKQKQRLLAVKKTMNQNAALTKAGSVKQSPSKPALSREMRGLLGVSVGGARVGLVGVAELLQDSDYPRTRHAIIELQRS